MLITKDCAKMVSRIQLLIATKLERVKKKTTETPDLKKRISLKNQRNCPRSREMAGIEFETELILTPLANIEKESISNTVDRAGFEPTTFCMPGESSATELSIR